MNDYDVNIKFCVPASDEESALLNLRNVLLFIKYNVDFEFNISVDKVGEWLD